MSDYNSIQQSLQIELQAFERKFKEATQSQTPLLDKIIQYIIHRKGKQIRPLLVMISAQLFGEINDKTYRGASLIELLHTATLVHDDVVDDSYQRRGFFSVNALWKNKAAVLVGDYLLSKGLLLSIDNSDFDLLKIVSEAVRAMSEGELLQMEKARKLHTDEKIYFEIIEKKTASLINAACSVGALSQIEISNPNFEPLNKMSFALGMAFQIKDDLLDYSDLSIGKPLGQDIKENKMTLPIIFALNNAPSNEKKSCISWIKNIEKDKSLSKKIIDFANEFGGIQYAENIMNKYHKTAIENLNLLPNSAAKENMKSLIDFVVQRKK